MPRPKLAPGQRGEPTLTPLDSDGKTIPRAVRNTPGHKARSWNCTIYYCGWDGKSSEVRVHRVRQTDAVEAAHAKVDAALARGSSSTWSGVTIDTPLADAARAWLELRTSDDTEDLTRVHGETSRVYGYVADYIADPQRGLHLTVGQVTHKAARDFIYLQRRPTPEDIAKEQAQVEKRRDTQRKIVAAWDKWAAVRRSEGLAAYPLPADVTAPIPDVDPATLLYPSRAEMTWVVLRGLYTALADNGVVPANPLREIAKPTVPAARKSAPRVLRGEQMGALMRAVHAYTETTTLRTTPPRSQWLVPQLALLLSTGLRITEVNNLRWEDFDMTDSRLWWVTPHRQKKRDTGGVQERIALPPSVIPVLRRWRSQQVLSPWVLPMRDDPTRPMTRSGKTLTEALTWARLPHRSGDDVVQADRELLPPVISYHDLRHTVATAMAATGNAALATLQLGHASASTTEAAYINRAVDVDNSAVIEAFAADALRLFG
ncbi:site-specific integrase [Corynebacterium sp. HMSC14B06]|uniref:tyrosine-type recombinase/integrase n=1 Tax=Corynebacterium sp. HMSC14B06 TaxID=1581098 RepID=UPI0009F6BB93|nr:site-specific integrase [Corynebacterium sp. HMSC14B06]